MAAQTSEKTIKKVSQCLLPRFSVAQLEGKA
jgi:hypothetical protein